LERDFDRLFTRRTGFVDLNEAPRRIHEKRDDLLLVLERPEIPPLFARTDAASGPGDIAYRDGIAWIPSVPRQRSACSQTSSFPARQTRILEITGLLRTYRDLLGRNLSLLRAAGVTVSFADAMIATLGHS
jgi:hypothetical protein